MLVIQKQLTSYTDIVANLIVKTENKHDRYGTTNEATDVGQKIINTSIITTVEN